VGDRSARDRNRSLRDPAVIGSEQAVRAVSGRISTV
jgi:hypothetical protein